MDVATFGQTIKQKYPQYQDMPDAELGQKMLSKYPQYQDMVQTSPDTSIPLGILKAAGGGWISDLAAAAQQPGRMATGQQGPNPLLDPGQQQAFSGDIGSKVGQVGWSALDDLIGAIGTASSVGGLAKVAPYATYKGLANVTGEAAKSAAPISWEGVTSAAKQGVKGTGLKQAIGEIAAQYTPAGVGDVSMSGPDALAVRRELLKRYGTGILDWLTGPNENKMAAGQLRNALSAALHTAAPETQLPDKLYSMYKMGGPLLSGDIPQKLLKLGIGIPAIRGILGPVLGKIAAAATHE